MPAIFKIQSDFVRLNFCTQSRKGEIFFGPLRLCVRLCISVNPENFFIKT
jgi:hypothetical protein